LYFSSPPGPDRVCLERERAAREAAESRRRELEDRVQELERMQAGMSDEREERASRLADMERQMEEIQRQKDELEAARARVEEIRLQLESEAQLSQEERRRLQEENQRAQALVAAREDEARQAAEELQTMRGQQQQQQQQQQRQRHQAVHSAAPAAPEPAVQPRRANQALAAATPQKMQPSMTAAPTQHLREIDDEPQKERNYSLETFQNGEPTVPRAEYREEYMHSRDVKARLDEMRDQFRSVRHEDRVQPIDKIHESNVREGRSKFRTLQKIRMGNTKKRIDEFESILKDWKTGRLKDWKTGRLEDWKTGRLEDWKTGRPEDRRPEDRKTGRLEDWKTGDRKTGRPEDWKTGRPEDRRPEDRKTGRLEDGRPETGRQEDRKTGRSEDWKTGRPEDRKTGRLEDRKTGRLEDWKKKTGRLEDRKTGRLEDRKMGRPEDWKTGRPEDWKTGRAEYWKTGREKDWKTGRWEDRKTGRLEDRKTEDWKTGRLERLEDWKTGRLEDWKTETLKHWKTGKLEDRKTERPEDWKTRRLEDRKTGRQEDRKTGRLEEQKTRRLEDWKTGRAEDRKTGRLEERKTGREEDWKTGRLEERKTGRLEDRKIGRREKCRVLEGRKADRARLSAVLDSRTSREASALAASHCSRFSETERRRGLRRLMAARASGVKPRLLLDALWNSLAHVLMAVLCTRVRCQFAKAASDGALRSLGANKGRTAGRVRGAGVSQQTVDVAPSPRLSPPHLLHRLRTVGLGADDVACQLESPTAQQIARTGQAGAMIERRVGDSLVADLEGGAQQASVRRVDLSLERVSALYNRTVSITAWNSAALWRSGKSSATPQILADVGNQTAEVDELLTSWKLTRLSVSASAEDCSLGVHDGLLRVDHQADARRNGNQPIQLSLGALDGRGQQGEVIGVAKHAEPSLRRKPSSLEGRAVRSTQSSTRINRNGASVSPWSTPEDVSKKSDRPSGVETAAVVPWYSAMTAEISSSGTLYAALTKAHKHVVELCQPPRSVPAARVPPPPLAAHEGREPAQ
uniref:ERM domain-containing protein n=1 Tax=Macrostomum lignano TaxID=282301 RepID=A0A1I8ICL8_9PLAT